MRLRLYGAIFGFLVGAFSQKGELAGAILYDAYTAQEGRVVHMIMSDNATPDNLSDDWLVDWEYLDN